MKLMTKEIEKKLPKLYANEKKQPSEILVVAKYFAPWGNWTWYVTEGDKIGDDWQFFGMVHGMEKELGYFALSELEDTTGPFGLTIERDMYFGKHYLSEFMN